HVHDIDFRFDVGERIGNVAAEYLVGMGVHRNDVVAVFAEVIRNFVGVLPRRRRTPDDRHRIETNDFGEFLVVSDWHTPPYVATEQKNGVYSATAIRPSTNALPARNIA